MELLRREPLLGSNKVIIGSPTEELVLETLGKLYIKQQNSFIDVIECLENLNSSDSDSTYESKVEFTQNIAAEDPTVYKDGIFMFDVSSLRLYLVYKNKFRFVTDLKANSESDVFVKRDGSTDMSGTLVIKTTDVPLQVTSKKLVKNLNAELFDSNTTDAFAMKEKNETIKGDYTFNGASEFNGTAKFNNKTTFNRIATFNRESVFNDNSTFNRNIIANGNIRQATGDFITDGSMGSSSFASGFTGHGWRLDANTNTLTIDNLVVRGILSVFELVVNKISATNGSLWVTDSFKVGEVKPVTEVGITDLGSLDNFFSEPQYEKYYKNDTAKTTEEELTNDEADEVTTEEGGAETTKEIKSSSFVIFYENSVSVDDPSYNAESMNRIIINASNQYNYVSSGISVYNRSGLNLRSFPYYVYYDFYRINTSSTITGDVATNVESHELLQYPLFISNYIRECIFTATYTFAPISLPYSSGTPVANVKSVSSIEQQIAQQQQQGQQEEETIPTSEYVCTQLVSTNTYFQYFCNNPMFVLYPDDEADYPNFQPGDLLKCQKFTGNSIKQYNAIVLNTAEDFILIQLGTGPLDYYTEYHYDSEGNMTNSTSERLVDDQGRYITKFIPEKGDTLVRIGNIFNTDRQGSLFLTSSEQYSPYIDTMSGVCRPDYNISYWEPEFETVQLNLNGKSTIVYPFTGPDTSYASHYGSEGDEDEFWYTFIPTVYTPTAKTTIGNTEYINCKLKNYTRARFGRLDGIYNEYFGNHQPHGYGLYGENVFLAGQFYLNNGKSVASFDDDIKLLSAGTLEELERLDNKIDTYKTNSNSVLENLTKSIVKPNLLRYTKDFKFSSTVPYSLVNDDLTIPETTTRYNNCAINTYNLATSLNVDYEGVNDTSKVIQYTSSDKKEANISITGYLNPSDIYATFNVKRQFRGTYVNYVITWTYEKTGLNASITGYLLSDSEETVTLQLNEPQTSFFNVGFDDRVILTVLFNNSTHILEISEEDVSYHDLLHINTAFDVNDGDYYTLSYWAKGQGELISVFYGQTNVVAKVTNSSGQSLTNTSGFNQITLSNTWQRHWTTFKIGGDSQLTLLLRHIGPLLNLELCGLKFEKNDIPTDYIENEQDYKDYTNEVGNQAKDYTDTVRQQVIAQAVQSANQSIQSSFATLLQDNRSTFIHEYSNAAKTDKGAAYTAQVALGAGRAGIAITGVSYVEGDVYYYNSEADKNTYREVVDGVTKYYADSTKTIPVQLGDPVPNTQYVEIANDSEVGLYGDRVKIYNYITQIYNNTQYTKVYYNIQTDYDAWQLDNQNNWNDQNHLWSVGWVANIPEQCIALEHPVYFTIVTGNNSVKYNAQYHFTNQVYTYNNNTMQEVENGDLLPFVLARDVVAMFSEGKLSADLIDVDYLKAQIIDVNELRSKIIDTDNLIVRNVVAAPSAYTNTSYRIFDAYGEMLPNTATASEIIIVYYDPITQNSAYNIAYDYAINQWTNYDYEQSHLNNDYIIMYNPDEYTYDQTNHRWSDSDDVLVYERAVIEVTNSNVPSVIINGNTGKLTAHDAEITGKLTTTAINYNQHVISSSELELTSPGIYTVSPNLTTGTIYLDPDNFEVGDVITIINPTENGHDYFADVITGGSEIYGGILVQYFNITNVDHPQAGNIAPSHIICLDITGILYGAGGIVPCKIDSNTTGYTTIEPSYGISIGSKSYTQCGFAGGTIELLVLPDTNDKAFYIKSKQCMYFSIVDNHNTNNLNKLLIESGGRVVACYTSNNTWDLISASV